MPVSEHMYGVAITVKMSEQVEQWICIKFCVSLTIPPQKLFRWFRRPQLWASGDWQLHHDNVPTHASRLMQSFFAKPQITQWLSPVLAPCNFWLFPKLKLPLKRERFQTISESQENTTGSWWQLGEQCEVLRCLLWRWLRCHCPVYNVSCILYLLQ